jgi:hypothetical protein
VQTIKRFLWGKEGFSPVSWLIQGGCLFLGAGYMLSDGAFLLGIPIMAMGCCCIYMMVKRFRA